MRNTIHVAGLGATIVLQPQAPLSARGRNGWFAVARIRVQPDLHQPGQTRLEVYSRRSTYPPPVLVELDRPAARAVAGALLQATGIDLVAAFESLRAAQIAYGALCAEAECGAFHAYQEADELLTDAAHDTMHILEQICAATCSPAETVE